MFFVTALIPSGTLLIFHAGFEVAQQCVYPCGHGLPLGMLTSDAQKQCKTWKCVCGGQRGCISCLLGLLCWRSAGFPSSGGAIRWFQVTTSWWRSMSTPLVFGYSSFVLFLRESQQRKKRNVYSLCFHHMLGCLRRRHGLWPEIIPL